MFFQNKLQIFVMKLSVIEGANLTCLKIEDSKVCQKRASILSLPKNLIRKLMRDGARINRIKNVWVTLWFRATLRYPPTARPARTRRQTVTTL